MSKEKEDSKRSVLRVLTCLSLVACGSNFREDAVDDSGPAVPLSNRGWRTKPVPLGGGGEGWATQLVKSSIHQLAYLEPQTRILREGGKGTTCIYGSLVHCIIYACRSRIIREF